jgi:ABC-2 type transport system permease protein
MLHLLKIEWLKVKNYRTFWILSALYIISLFGVNYIAFNVQQKIYNAKALKDVGKFMLGQTPYSFPFTWQMTSYVSGFLFFIPGLLMIIAMTNEYSFKTHRQNIIDGLSRTDFILTKMALTFILALVSTVVVFITAIIFGLLDGTGSFSFDKFYYVGLFFVQMLSFSTLALLISVLVKRSGIAIGVYFLYTVVIENMIAAALNYFIGGVGRFLPAQVNYDLFRIPILQSVQNNISTESNVYIMLTLAIVYLIAYYFIIKRKFETDDL